MGEVLIICRILGTQVPMKVTNVPDDILQPARQWADQAAFDKALRHLATLYATNFQKYASGGGFVSKSVAASICTAGPKIQ